MRITLTKEQRETCAKLGIDGSRLAMLYNALNSDNGRALEDAFTSRTAAALLVGFRQGVAYANRRTEPE